MNNVIKFGKYKTINKPSIKLSKSLNSSSPPMIKIRIMDIKYTIIYTFLPCFFCKKKSIIGRKKIIIKRGCWKTLSKRTLNLSKSDNSSIHTPLLIQHYFTILLGKNLLIFENILLINSSPIISDKFFDLYAMTKYIDTPTTVYSNIIRIDNTLDVL